MYDTVSVLLFYLGIAELMLSGYLFWMAYSAMRHARGRSFYRTMRILCVAVLLFFTIQAVSKLRLVGEDVLQVADVLSSILLVLLLISLVRELVSNMLAHEHLVRHKRHGKPDVE